MFHYYFLNTKQKIFIASFLYRIISFVRTNIFRKSDNSLCNRRGINWNLDLSEGIDFSIWLLGGFELRTQRIFKKLIKEGDVVFDIGANIGCHTLHFAKIVGSKGKVYTFEPTDYAYQKLICNVSLNPNISAQVENNQVMLVSDEQYDSVSLLYSSWPLNDSKGLHDQHRGKLKSLTGAVKTTLDEFVRSNRINKLDFIKIDVDGNEAYVLKGGWNTVQKFRPIILTELAPYLFSGTDNALGKFFSRLIDLGYEIRDVASGRLLPDNLGLITEIIPESGSVNVLLCPKSLI